MNGPLVEDMNIQFFVVVWVEGISCLSDSYMVLMEAFLMKNWSKLKPGSKFEKFIEKKFVHYDEH